MQNLQTSSCEGKSLNVQNIFVTFRSVELNYAELFKDLEDLITVSLDLGQ